MQGTMTSQAAPSTTQCLCLVSCCCRLPSLHHVCTCSGLCLSIPGSIMSTVHTRTCHSSAHFCLRLSESQGSPLTQEQENTSGWCWCGCCVHVCTVQCPCAGAGGWWRHCTRESSSREGRAHYCIPLTSHNTPHNLGISTIVTVWITDEGYGVPSR